MQNKQIQLRSMVDRLNSTCRNALEEAGRIGVARTNYDIEIEHWLSAIVNQPNTDLALILKHFSIGVEAFHHDLLNVLNGLKTGNTRTPGLSQHLISLMRDAWIVCSLDLGHSTVRSGHLMTAILKDPRSYGVPTAVLVPADVDTIVKDFEAITSLSCEREDVGAGKATVGSPNLFSSSKTLDKYTIDLTEQARAGKIDPIAGRNEEIRQIIDILCRRRQNNPILTGEAGVGKTAIVEGFALRVVHGDVPEKLRDISIRTLDMALLQAGAGVRGEFENRLKSVIEEVKSSPKPIILFIDEAHNLVGAGGQAGQGDAANLLKPALARGELRTIAATTWAEYKKYFEEDAALARRFQVVPVAEPDEPTTVQMIRGLTATLEDHHKIRIRNDAVIDSVRLSNRYITGRQLPDKAVSVIDTACARINLSQNSTPPMIEDLIKAIHFLDVEKNALKRESVADTNHSIRLKQIDEELSVNQTELESLQARWTKEKVLVGTISKLYEDFRRAQSGKPSNSKDKTELRDPLVIESEIGKAEQELKTIQSDQPLVHACCDREAIAETVSAWTGIPLGRMMTDEIENILNLGKHLEQSVVGQSHAIKQIAETIQFSRAQLADPEKPIGVFMLAGPSGVGKTETALSLANLLFGGDQNLTTINMSEFKGKENISKLTGASPGLVGYGKGGILTEAIRQKPYSVVLLDEMEKADKEVQEVFYQVFDKGSLTDGTGRNINFRNTVIIMTTNAASELVTSLVADKETAPTPEVIAKTVHEELIRLDLFKPAFLGRLTLVPYFPLPSTIIEKIAGLKLNKIKKRAETGYQAEVSIDPNIATEIAARCNEVATGARNIDKIISNTLLPQLSGLVLQRMAQSLPIKKISIALDKEKQFVIDIS